MVFKRVNRIPLKIVDDPQLDANMTAAFKTYFTRHGKLSDILAEDVEDLFYDIKSNEQWVLCDCRPYKNLDTAPLLHPVEGPILRRHTGEKGHIDGCAFLEPKGQRPLSEKTYKVVEPAREPRVVRDFSLVRSFRKRGADNGRTERLRQPSSSRIRSSTHAYLLLTLLDRAKINRWDAGLPRDSLIKQYEAIRDKASELPVDSDFTVGDLIVSSAKLIGRREQSSEVLSEPVTLLSKIAAAAPNWSSTGRPHGFLCTRVDSFAEGEINFGKNYFPTKMANKPHVFAERGETMEGPYIALISFAKITPSDEYYTPYGSYAQPCYSTTDCAPMDSMFEKRTLGYLLSVQRGEVANKGVVFNIVKPLFDISVMMMNGEKAWCRPDFVIEIIENGRIRRKIVVETMGLEGKEDYDLSKTRTHPRMRRIDGGAILVPHVVTRLTDDLTEDDRTFFRKLYIALRENREAD